MSTSTKPKHKRQQPTLERTKALILAACKLWELRTFGTTISEQQIAQWINHIRK